MKSIKREKEMARSFATNTKITYNPASFPMSDWPTTLHMWAKRSGTGTATALSMHDASQQNTYNIIGKLSSTPVIFGARRDEGAQRSTNGATALGTGWRNTIHIIASDTDSELFMDGSSDATETANVNYVAGIDQFSVGNLNRLSPISFYDGDLAHAAVWKVVLSDDNIRSVARGVNPLVVDTDNLVFYSPINGNEAPEPEYINQDDGGVTNSPAKVAGPPVELVENYL